MGRLSKTKAKLALCKIVLLGKIKPMKIMYCQHCKNIFFDTLIVKEDNKDCYQAVYQCTSCGAIVEETQRWRNGQV